MHEMNKIIPNEVKPLAIVMGRNYTTRLTLARAAGLVGCDVVLIQTNRRKNNSLKIDRSSRFVVNCHFCPEPNQQLLIDTIRIYEHSNRKKLLIPADDYVASVIDKHLDVLKGHFLMPHVKGVQGEVLKIMDKSYQKALASKAGLEVAKGWVAEYIDKGFIIPTGISYPCFVKPMESYDGPLKNHSKRCDNEMELKYQLSKIASFYHLPLLIEQFVQIEKEYGVQGISMEDKTVIPSIVRKDSSLRGITATGQIYPITSFDGLEEKLAAFLKETCFTGIFDIDLFESNGKFYFNELNVRLGANGFAMTYGVSNVPGLFLLYLLGESKGEYEGPVDFKPLSFVSEQVIREMYYDGIISFKKYRRTIKEAEISSLQFKGDESPYKEFSKIDWILPLWRCLRKYRKGKK